MTHPQLFGKQVTYQDWQSKSLTEERRETEPTEHGAFSAPGMLVTRIKMFVDQ
jgi:hypothetical protein